MNKMRLFSEYSLYSLKQAMVVSGIHSCCHYTWQHKQVMCTLHFWVLCAGMLRALFHHILQQDVLHL